MVSLVVRQTTRAVRDLRCGQKNATRPLSEKPPCKNLVDAQAFKTEERISAPQAVGPIDAYFLAQDGCIVGDQESCDDLTAASLLDGGAPPWYATDGYCTAACASDLNRTCKPKSVRRELI